MPLGAITVLRRIHPRRGVREVVFQMPGAASYTTGGDAITAANLNLNAITDIQFHVSGVVDRQYLFDKANSKVMAQVISTGAQVAGSTNLSTDTVLGRAIGY